MKTYKIKYWIIKEVVNRGIITTTRIDDEMVVRCESVIIAINKIIATSLCTGKLVQIESIQIGMIEQ